MDVDEAADQVYGAPLPDFVATRDALAKQAADRGMAARIRSLRKPTVAAWLANQLSRRHAEDVERLVQTGLDMRAATAERDGGRLRELSTQGRDLVNTLLRNVRQIAGEAGQTVSAEVTEAVGDTLRAAMADPRAADAVISGRLARPLEHVGFGVPDAAAAPAEVISLERVRTARKTQTDQPAERRSVRDRATTTSRAATKGKAAPPPADRRPGATPDDAEQELAQAEGEVEAAESVVEQLTAERREARQRLGEAKRTHEDTQTGVKRAQRAHDEAEEELERIRRKFEAAEQAFNEAKASLEQATDNLARASSDVDGAQEDLNDREDELDEAYDRAQAARDRRRKARQQLKGGS